jgi:hypothetical protein
VPLLQLFVISAPARFAVPIIANALETESNFLDAKPQQLMKTASRMPRASFLEGDEPEQELRHST